MIFVKVDMEKKISVIEVIDNSLTSSFINEKGFFKIIRSDTSGGEPQEYIMVTSFQEYKALEAKIPFSQNIPITNRLMKIYKCNKDSKTYIFMYRDLNSDIWKRWFVCCPP